jgi:hypothetical protein
LLIAVTEPVLSEDEQGDLPFPYPCYLRNPWFLKPKKVKK